MFSIMKVAGLGAFMFAAALGLLGATTGGMALGSAGGWIVAGVPALVLGGIAWAGEREASERRERNRPS